MKCAAIKIASLVILCSIAAAAPYFIAKPIKAAFTGGKSTATEIADSEMARIERSDLPLYGCYQKGAHVFTAVYSNESERVDVWIVNDKVKSVQKGMPPCVVARSR